MKKFLDKNKYLLILFFVIVYFEPQIFKESYYKTLIYIDYVYKILKLIGVGFISYFYIDQFFLKRKRENKNIYISYFLIAMVSFQAIATFSTIINNGSITRFIGPALTTIFMVMACEILIDDKKLISTLTKINKYFRICFVIHILSIILIDVFNILPKDQVYFLGIDNRWMFTYLPWMTFEFFVAVANNKSKKVPLLVFILCEVTLVYKWSVGAMLFFGVWLLPLMLPAKLFKIPITMYISTVAMNIAIVICRIQNHFYYFFEYVLHKSLALSGRTFYWDKIFKTTKDNWILGEGMQDLAYDRNYFLTSSYLNYDFMAAGHAHNTYMNVLYRYGVLGLISYFILWVLAIGKLFLNRNSKYMKVLVTSLFCILLLSIVDTFDASGVYFIMALAYNIDKIKEGTDNV